MAGATKKPSGESRAEGLGTILFQIVTVWRWRTRSLVTQDLPAATGRSASRTASKIGRPDERSRGVHEAKKSFSKSVTSSVRRDSAFERTSASLVKSIVGNLRCMMSSRSNGHEIHATT